MCIRDSYYFAPPRVFENLLTTVMIRMEDAGATKRGMFHYFMAVAKRCGSDILDGKPNVSSSDRLLYALGNLLVYGPLRNVLGMSRIRVAYTAGAAIGPDLFRFYRSKMCIRDSFMAPCSISVGMPGASTGWPRAEPASLPPNRRWRTLPAATR